MALASNLLNALGGSPCFTEAPYLPPFPGKLLRTIERPGCWGIDIDVLPLSDAALTMMIGVERPDWDGGPTIGEFYNTEVVALLPTDDASYAGGRQLALWDNPGAGRLFAITSMASAQRAVTEVLDGRGRRLERRHPRRRLPRAGPLLALQGDPGQRGQQDARRGERRVPGDRLAQGAPRQVQPLATGRQRGVQRDLQPYARFAREVLSGEHPDVYPSATGLMEQLHHKAALLRQTGLVAGTPFVPGPTFEYVPAKV
jgi:Ferritin-like